MKHAGSAARVLVISCVVALLLLVLSVAPRQDGVSLAAPGGDSPTTVPAQSQPQRIGTPGLPPRATSKHPKFDSAIAALAESVASQPEMARASALSDGYADERIAAMLQTGMLKIDESSRVQVYLYVTRYDGDVQGELEGLGVVVERQDERGTLVQASVPLLALEQLASLVFVKSVQAPDYGVVNRGSRMTEGDALLNFASLRGTFGVDGSGVSVGVISDGIYGLSQAIASGDLPATSFTRDGTGKLVMTAGGVIATSFRADRDLEGGLGEQYGAEGTAMLEIVHDIAPGAQLHFANFATSLEFMAAVDWLASVCDVVVDDIGFYARPYDQTSDVSANTSTELNRPANRIRGYYTAVGNDAKSHYEGMYVNSGVSGLEYTGRSGNLHLFQQTADTTDCFRLGGFFSNPIYLAKGQSVTIWLTWDDIFGAPTTDYDLYLWKNPGGPVVAKSEDDNVGTTKEPVEGLGYINNTGEADYFDVFIQNFENASPPRRLELFVLGGSPLTCPEHTHFNFNTAASSVSAQGDAGGGVVSVGATNADDPGTDTIASYSSRGPTNNGAIKPDVTAIDGVRVTGAGGFSDPFFGTSAAAPHVAALAALLLELRPEWKAGEQGDDPASDRAALRAAILDGAIDLGVAGMDNTFGAGRVDGLRSAQEATPVVFPDAGLDAAIREALGKQPGEEITLAEVLGLTTLDAHGRGITELTGIEKCANLTSLNLSQNELSDIALLAALTRLTWLDLTSNKLSDVSSLASLSNLVTLGLAHNQIDDVLHLSTLTHLTGLSLGDNRLTDVVPLAPLLSLTELYVEFNQISDTAPLSALTGLTKLYLHNNLLSDLSPLSSLTNLSWLSVSDNDVADIAPLGSLTGLRKLWLNGNQVSDISPLASLVHLTHLYLKDNSIDNTAPIGSLVNLTELGISGNRINDISPLSSLTVLDKLWANRNQISDISPLSGLAVLTSLQLMENQITDLSPVTSLSGLKSLYLCQNLISDVTPLASLTSLETLSLSRNQIADIGPLSSLMNLTFLWLYENQIADVAPLDALTSLSLLNLNGNLVSDLSALASLTGLTDLQLSRNHVVNVEPLDSLTNLTGLWLDENQIEDISPLTSLPELVVLELSGNPLSSFGPLGMMSSLYELGLTSTGLDDAAPLATLVNLGKLKLSDNQLVDISSLTSLVNLQVLNISNNRIVDISTLASLTLLYDLRASGNQISSLVALGSLTKLSYLDLKNNLIEDIESLVSNTGLGTGDVVFLQGNRLELVEGADDVVNIRALEARGVVVHTDPIAVTYSIDLVVGLNFITLPITPTTPLTAAGLVADIATQGGQVVQVDAWDESTGMWKSYKPDITPDLPMDVGRGYFLKVTQGIAWRFVGYPLNTGVLLNLVVGLNGIGIPYASGSATASALASAITAQGGEVVQIDMWDESVGMWKSFKPDITPDFTIEGWRGYFLKITQGTTFTP